MNKQPWIGKPWIDIIFILLPAFLSLLIVILFPSLFQDTNDMTVAGVMRRKTPRNHYSYYQGFLFYSFPA
jgi:hypothetical protein